MFTAIIADDEHKIGQLIERLIHWDALGITLLATVENGVDALELIRTKKPDIAITDIRMPKMDGLELIRQAKEEGYPTKFVVISGYRHFEYAHSALKYGVEDYLLKPMKEDELNEILAKICMEKREICETQSEQTFLRQELHKSRSILHRELIEKVISDRTKLDMIAPINKDYALSLEAALYQATVLKLDHREPLNPDSAQDALVVNKLMEMIDEQMSPLVIERILASKDGTLIYCIFNFALEQQEKVAKSLDKLFSIAQDYIYAFNAYELTMGLGSVEVCFAGIKSSLSDALTALQYRIVLGVGRKIIASEEHFLQPLSKAVLVERYRQMLVNIVDSFSVTKLNELIEKVFFSLSQQVQVNPCTYYDTAIQIVDSFFKLVLPINEEELTQERNELLQLIPNIYTITQLTLLLCKRLSDCLARCETLQMAQSSKPVRDAKLYIDEHYADKILLEDIAGIVNLNPVYFSVVFKKETDNNFSDYLCNVRMEAAKTLLRSANDTIAAVADKVGYKDTRYFSQTFTKIVGIKPTHYRKLYS